MPVKQTGTADGYREIDRFDTGVGWIAHPDEAMQRASHALSVDEGVYLIDPLNIPDLEELIGDLGEVAGIVVLLDRHGRDAIELARKYEVPIHLPAEVNLDVPADVTVERHDRTLANTEYELLEVVDWPGWRETALFDGETFIVPEAVGTADFFGTGEQALGVQAVLRMTPPKALRGLDPDRILVGHGEGVHADASEALQRALDHSRRTAPRAWLGMARGLLSG